jgi:hypothetical protein
MTVGTTIMTVLHSTEVVHIPLEYHYTLLGCALGYHYKAFQWLNLVCSTPAEVSPEVSVQITKAPLLHRVVLRRVHSSTHSFPTRWILRASLNLHHRLVRQTSLYHILRQTIPM